MDARTKEAIRYLGYGRHAVDDHTLKLVESCFEELSQEACGRIVYRIFELEFPESGRILLGNLDIHSKNLYKNLTGCKKQCCWVQRLDRKLICYCGNIPSEIWQEW